MTASGAREGWLGGRGIGQKGRRTHGHGLQCGDCWEDWGIRGLKGNEKNIIKIKSKNKKNWDTYNHQVYSLIYCHVYCIKL